MKQLPILAKMAFRNVFKYGRRSVETFAVVFAGVAAVALVDAFLNGFSDRMISGFAVSGGQVLASAPGYKARRATCPLDKLVADPGALASAAESSAFEAARGKREEGVFAAIASLPSLRAPCVLQLGSRSLNACVRGADAALPGGALAPPFESSPIEKGRYPKQGERGLVLSSKQASRLGAEVGAAVVLLASDAYGSFGAAELPLLGVTRGDPGPDSCLVDLLSMRELLGVDSGATEVSLFLVDGGGRAVDPRRAPRSVAAIESAVLASGLEASRWDSSGNATAAMMGFYDAFMYAICAIFFIVAASGIANSVLLSVQDRTRDFATLRAVAFSASSVKAIVALETLFVAAAASFAAIAACCLVLTILGPEGVAIPRSVRGIAEWMPESIPARADAGALALIFLGGSLAPLAAAIYPLRVLGRMKIREALGYV